VAVLELEDVHAYYGPSHVLQGVNLSVPAGSIVALLGRNGAGKTTTMKAIMGLVDRSAGSIRFRGAEVCGLATHRLASLGISYIPESRGIIPGLTVAENIQVAVLGTRKADRAQAAMRVDRVMEWFPVLRERSQQLGTSLSGGQQQMLALARAFVGKPSLILVDEPTQGLAPKVVASIVEILTRLNREDGMAILLVEQNASLALEVAHHAFIMDEGVIRQSGTAADIRADRDIQRRYLGA
jgi:branched-chain amino acid transport system ATP-binding protein